MNRQVGCLRCPCWRRLVPTRPADAYGGGMPLPWLECVHLSARPTSSKRRQWEKCTQPRRNSMARAAGAAARTGARVRAGTGARARARARTAGRRADNSLDDLRTRWRQMCVFFRYGEVRTTPWRDVVGRAARFVFHQLHSWCKRKVSHCVNRLVAARLGWSTTVGQSVGGVGIIH